ncbi:hypothetical protein [Qipengyuania soli]|uniref:Uncharacterized protein n=1 Tax=Qipengyuania soli TaxID=2782568 RepID=A0A7S8F2C5_9SPHN|nr:hypothetical protein [Qipengyuania soli]QPC97841.1 hypothetical protein IRL76_07975 [Qipengyuania soli]
MLVTADSRAVLRDALRQRLGGQRAAEIEQVLPCPAGLSQVEKSAWLMLQNWSSDAPLREQYRSLDDYSRDRMEHLLGALD